ncbi:glycosyltransferase involved in cell wall biosynthesis [Silvimonas terrae]|uniref:Glycosyltransferase involved in cell wall biosynthesis n=1 Tax=Silvimonas terrae TaxID=300266 RepID=A0A840RCV2_9NEIS|nr:glycosyltransferase [Silvimonas terrae]MBB5190797.1 glycosyltransferase involved in cell wall biosynthesis [Silvimonas terrae]
MSVHEPTVSVVVPSYKRAHLLEQTLPTYLQEHVIELIVVDDCSPDNTPDVIAGLMKRDSRIRYLRQDRNQGQMAAKNRGKAQARGDYIYFGDDDSVLLPGSIAALLETARSHPGSVAGAAAVYMNYNETSPVAAAARRRPVQTPAEVVDLHQLRFRFDSVSDQLLTLPVCAACFLMEAGQALKQDFDSIYKGNAYREETDFLLRVAAQGVPMVMDTRAVQVNLPVKLSTGGSRKGFWRTEYYVLANSLLMIKRNRHILRQLAPGFSGATAMTSLLGERVGGVIRRNTNRGKKLWKMLTASA